LFPREDGRQEFHSPRDFARTKLIALMDQHDPPVAQTGCHPARMECLEMAHVLADDGALLGRGEGQMLNVGQAIGSGLVCGENVKSAAAKRIHPTKIARIFVGIQLRSVSIGWRGQELRLTGACSANPF
jgi:hypothetical protein